MAKVVNVYSTSVTSENISRQELLAWVNDCLQVGKDRYEVMFRLPSVLGSSR